MSRVGGRGGDSFISPAVQRERIEGWAAAHGHAVIDVLVDLDESGGSTERPEFQRAVERCEAGEADGIVVAKLDRFARSISGAADTIRRLDAAGATLVSVAENIDASGPGGRLMRTILFAFAEFERERIAESWATATGRAVARGVHVSPVPPTGYARGPDGALVPDPDTSRAVVSAFEARAQGASWAAVGRVLASAGAAPRQGSTSWTTPSVTRLIRNRVYLGEAFYGEHRNEGAHLALVSRALFEAANAARPTRAARAADGEGFLLAGLLRCAGCRYVMPGSWVAAKGDRVAKYRCRRLHPGGKCPECSIILARIVEPYVAEAWLAHHADLVLAGAQGDSLAALEGAVADAEHELRAYVEVMRAQDVGFREGYDARSGALTAARGALADAAARQPLGDVTIGELWADSSTSDRRALLAADIDAVFVRAGRAGVEERVRIVWRGEGVELPRRGAVTNALRAYTW